MKNRTFPLLLCSLFLLLSGSGLGQGVSERPETLRERLLILQERAKSSLASSDVEKSIAELKDPTAIVYLISVAQLQKDPGEYFALQKLTGNTNHGKTRNGTWWRTWWEENKHVYPESVRNLEIPAIDEPWNIPDLSREIAAWKNARQNQNTARNDPLTELTASLQMLRVSVPDPKKSEATVVAYSRSRPDAAWKRAFPEMPAQIGRNGMSRVGEKIEGDGTTPGGDFALTFAFGRLKTGPPGIKLPYREATRDDYWIDDPESPDYNRWFHGETPTVSHERLRLGEGTHVYDYAVVMEYNTFPVVPGKGSAVFLHIWRDEKSPTAGCVSLSEENLLRILRWLDPKNNPIIRIEPQEKPTP